MNPRHTCLIDCARAWTALPGKEAMMGIYSTACMWARRGFRSRAIRPVVENLEPRWVPVSLPPGFTATLVATGLNRPTAMEFAPDGRLFVAEQGGTLRVIDNGTLLATPFLTVNVDSTGERGLLGVTLDPNFAVNHYVYVYYTTATSPIHNRVSRFTANGDVAVPGSEVDLLDLNNLSSATNHNGGGIHFGIDGKLYIGVGENAFPSNSQTLSNLLGKMLRINPDGTIPTDNPFYNTATGVNRAIWAIGLRNPYTFAVQPGTGRIFINDVGQSTWEEIDDGIAGSNYGWPITEGPTTDPRFRSPLFAYGHGSGDTLGSAIVGGTFYDPAVQQFPTGYRDTYFFSDLTNGWIRDFHPSTGQATPFLSGFNGALVDENVDPAGNLYFLAYQDFSNSQGMGAVYKVSFTAPPPPPPTPNLAIYRPPYAQWIFTGPSGSQTTSFGAPGTDIPVPGDYDGDGKMDFAVFRPSTAEWLIQLSSGGARVIQFGEANLDVPIPGDYDGDHRTDLAVFRPTTDTWYILRSTAGPFARQFGAPGLDAPAPADYDGDGKTDLAVFRYYTATWYIWQSTAGPRAVTFGLSNQDQPIPADYDGDGKADMAVYRPSNSTWYILQSATGTLRQQALGQPGVSDVPVPFDYDGDGKLDLGVFHPQTAMWTILKTATGIQNFQFGQGNVDVPLFAPLVYRYRGGLSRLLGRSSVAAANSSDGSQSTIRTATIAAPQSAGADFVVIPQPAASVVAPMTSMGTRRRARLSFTHPGETG